MDDKTPNVRPHFGFRFGVGCVLPLVIGIVYVVARAAILPDLPKNTAGGFAGMAQLYFAVYLVFLVGPCVIAANFLLALIPWRSLLVTFLVGLVATFVVGHLGEYLWGVYGL